jgi:hypothetical protein
MGTADAVHPTERTLHSYSLGRLDDTASESVSKHLQSCPKCQARVAEISSDSFLGRLRGAQAQRDKSATGWSPSSGFLTDRDPAVGSPLSADTMPAGLAEHPDYEVVRELGRGGMGVVYLAHNRLLCRNEVLKVMSRHIMERPGLLARFMAEMRAVASLQHPNIVTAYSAFRLGERILFAMEYVDGLDLARLVKTKGALPIVNACYFVNQAAQGLQHAHEKGMVHRDIKPGNLMLTHLGKRAQIKVLDFGLAKATREAPADGGLTNPGQALGTPDYMAPEQIRDAQKADIRADIYSLGCTLYYLLSGGPPFRAENLWDLYQAHHSTDAKPLNFVRPDVPSELAAVVARMMAKEPARRFQTPAAVADALAPFFKKGSVGIRATDAEVSQVGQTVVNRESPGTGPVLTQAATSVAPAPPRSAEKPPQTPRAEPAWESLIEFKETESLREMAPLVVSKPKMERPRWLWPAAAAGALLLAFIAAMVALNFNRTSPTVKEIKSDARHDPSLASHPIEDDAGALEKRANKKFAPTLDRTQFTRYAGQWHREGDNEVVQSDAAIQFSELLFGDDNWTDYEFTVDVMPIRGSTFSLFFRCTDPNNGLRYVVAGPHTNMCYLEEIYHNKMTILDGISGTLRYREWYTAHVKVSGNQIVCFVSDSEGINIGMFDRKYDGANKGRVGLRTWFSAYRFKNIKVTAPDGRVLWDGPPAIESPKPTESPKPVNSSKQAAVRQEGFVRLFNGTDLTGWVAPDDKSLFTVENGEIVGRSSERLKKNEYLATEKSYSDFILKAKVKIRNGNSGIQFRSKRDADGAVSGPQADVADDQWGVLYEERGRFELGRYPLDKALALLEEDGWNEFVISAIGSHLTIDLNGTSIIDRDDPKFDKEGIIALQVHVWPVPMEVRFRNIEIKDLSAANSVVRSPISAVATPTQTPKSPVNKSASGAGKKTGRPSRAHLGGVEKTAASGLAYRDIKDGTGPSPTPGQTCTVHYTGWL